MFIDSFQEETWRKKYQYKDETYEGFAHRIADSIFSEDKENNEKLFNIILECKALFGGRINSNIGVDMEGLTLFNCFIEALSKQPDSLEGIFDIITNYALTLKSEGGVGFCANFFRPADTIIKKIGVTSPGPIKFLEIFDKVSEVITSGGVAANTSFQGTPTKKSIRKGATMVTMSINHPDIEEFITAKSIPNRLTKMNMSVLVTDDFVKAVEANTDWDLWYPDINFEKYDEEWNGDFVTWRSKGYPEVVYKTVKAVELWDLLMYSSHSRNEPGVLFVDSARRMDNLSYLEGSSMLATNPCQPGWATVLTPSGIDTIDNIKIGSFIWSEDGWVKVINKVDSGIKDVYRYRTTAGVFYGTENHKVVSNGVKIEAGKSESIDQLIGPEVDCFEFSPKVIMDGIVVGDGSVHKASNNLVHLYIGENDSDYFDSEINQLILKHRPGLKYNAWEIDTTIASDEMALTFDRQIPNRFVFGDETVVRSFLRGIYSANGSVVGKGKRITLKTSSWKICEAVQIMLSSLGIRSYYTTNKPKIVKFKNGEFECKQSYDVNISVDRIKFAEQIGFIHRYKMDKIEMTTSPVRKETYEIKEIDYVSTEEVFDITVDGKQHTYWSGGCNISNCAEIFANTGNTIYNGIEYALGDVCNLGSINLVKYYNIEENRFCITDFKKDVDVMVRALDNVIEVSNYPLDMYANAAKLKRKIGLGMMGIGSLMMMMNLRYGSEECVDILDSIGAEFINQAYETSALMAKEKGPFPLWDKKALDGGFIKNSGVLRPEVIKLIKKHGLRNSALTAIAPNGSLSIVAGNVSGGLEPVFAREYTRWSRMETADFEYPNIHKGQWFETDYFKKSKAGDEEILMSTDGRYRIDKNTGLCEQITIKDYGYREAEKYGFENIATAMELNVDEHLNVLKTISKYIDQSSSKTINLSNDISFEDFKKVYSKIHSLGIKGCTTYREGTSVAILEVQRKDQEKTVKQQQEEFLAAFKDLKDNELIFDDVALPDEYPAKGYKLTSEGKKWYLHVAFMDESKTRPFAIFVNTNNKEDNVSTFNALEKLEELAISKGIKKEHIEETKQKYNYQKNPVKICRMLGLLLRHNVQVYDIIKTMDTLDAHMGAFVFRIKKFLGQFVEEHEVGGMVCPACGEKSIIFQEGCHICSQCGTSKCG